MSHTIRNKAKLLPRVRRIVGQLEAVARALEAEKSCTDVLHLLAGARGAMNGLMGEVVEEHIEAHFGNEATTKAAQRRAATELRQVVRTYLK
ncbi:MAG: metal/formaldehyde-sensitive transcriptional repressor [Candidatus Velthaea sp.]